MSKQTERHALAVEIAREAGLPDPCSCIKCDRDRLVLEVEAYRAGFLKIANWRSLQNTADIRLVKAYASAVLSEEPMHALSNTGADNDREG